MLPFRARNRNNVASTYYRNVYKEIIFYHDRYVIAVNVFKNNNIGSL